MKPGYRKTLARARIGVRVLAVATIDSTSNPPDKHERGTAMTTTVSPASRTHEGVELPVARHLRDRREPHPRGLRRPPSHGLQDPWPASRSFSGTITIGDDPVDSSVEVTIDTAGVDTGDEKRDGHLLSADFFDVEHYPTISYRSTAGPPGSARAASRSTASSPSATSPGRSRFTSTFEGAVTDPWGNTRAGFTAQRRGRPRRLRAHLEPGARRRRRARRQEDHHRDRGRRRPPA